MLVSSTAHHVAAAHVVTSLHVFEEDNSQKSHRKLVDTQFLPLPATASGVCAFVCLEPMNGRAQAADSLVSIARAFQTAPTSKSVQQRIHTRARGCAVGNRQAFMWGRHLRAFRSKQHLQRSEMASLCRVVSSRAARSRTFADIGATLYQHLQTRRTPISSSGHEWRRPHFAACVHFTSCVQ